MATACRRASTGNASSSGCAAVSSSRSVSGTTTNACFEAADPAECARVVAVDSGRGSRSNGARTIASVPRRRGLMVRRSSPGEGKRVAPVHRAVGDCGDKHCGVDRSAQAACRSRRGQPSGGRSRRCTPHHGRARLGTAAHRAAKTASSASSPGGCRRRGGSRAPTRTRCQDQAARGGGPHRGSAPCAPTRQAAAPGEVGVDDELRATSNSSGASSAPRLSGPVTRLAGAGRTWRPRRRARQPLPAVPPSAWPGSILDVGRARACRSRMSVGRCRIEARGCGGNAAHDDPVAARVSTTGCAGRARASSGDHRDLFQRDEQRRTTSIDAAARATGSATAAIDVGRSRRSPTSGERRRAPSAARTASSGR